jgi:hypothetical protein
MEATFSGTAIIMPQEKEIEMKTNYINTIRVKFPNSNKTYDYQMTPDGMDGIDAGDNLRIMNENLYCYSNTLVTCDSFIPGVSNSASKKIVAYYLPEYEVGWIDLEWLKDNQKTIPYSTLRQKLKNLCGGWVDVEDVFNLSLIDKIYDSSASKRIYESEYVSKWEKELDTSRDTATNARSLDYCLSTVSVQSNVGDSLKDLSSRVSEVEKAISFAGEAMRNVTCQTADFVEKNKNNNTLKGENEMNIFGNLDFGKVKHDNFAMTLKGLAFYSVDTTSENTQGTYVQYNAEKNEFEDVTPFILHDIKVKDFLFKMPVALSQIKPGDIIFDNRCPVFVKSVEGSEITVVVPHSRQIRTILATKNAFNFNFVTKLVNLMDNFNFAGSASVENPFGNILPLILLTGDNKSMDDMLPLMLMSNGGTMDFTSNPMMMYFLMKDGKSSDMLPFLLMGNPNLFGAPAPAPTVTDNEG